MSEILLTCLFVLIAFGCVFLLSEWLARRLTRSQRQQRQQAANGEGGNRDRRQRRQHDEFQV